MCVLSPIRTPPPTMQSLSVQFAPISAPRMTTERSIVVCGPTMTPRSSTTRPPTRAPSAIRQPRSTSADGMIRPSLSTDCSTTR